MNKCNQRLIFLSYIISNAGSIRDERLLAWLAIMFLLSGYGAVLPVISLLTPFVLSSPGNVFQDEDLKRQHLSEPNNMYNHLESLEQNDNDLVRRSSDSSQCLDLIYSTILDAGAVGLLLPFPLF